VDALVTGDAPSTKTAAALIAELTSGRNVLVVLDRADDVSYKSVRNLKDLHVLSWDQLNAYDVLVSDDILFTKAAFDAFVGKNQKGGEDK
jgi:large subunit ribosomal protein L4